MSIYETDIAVIGGGLAGVAAALSARRTGARVLMVEKNPCPGGMAVGARVHSLLTFHSCHGQRIVGGIAQQVVDRLGARGGTTGHIRDTVGVAYSVTPTDPDVLAATLMAMLDDAGVDHMLESCIVQPSLEGSRIASLQGYHTGGAFALNARVFIDASGDGMLASSCGCPFERGREGKVMPATLLFSVRGVNLKTVCRYMKKYPDEFHHETLFDRIETSRALGVSGFFSLWKKAGLSVPRDRLLFYQTLSPDEVAINTTRVTDFDPLSPSGVASAHRTALEQVYEIYHFLGRKVPGFEHCRISSIAGFLGVREGRRIRGRSMLTGDDVVSGRRFDDEIALGGFPVDIHLPGGSGIESSRIGGSGFYGIPYRCLLPLGMDNLLSVGRCMSLEFEAHASARVQATVMAAGEAAGMAAALSVEKDINPEDISPALLRQRLSEAGAMLEPGPCEDLP